jgi:hypothetical protein
MIKSFKVPLLVAGLLLVLVGVQIVDHQKLLYTVQSKFQDLASKEQPTTALSSPQPLSLSLSLEQQQQQQGGNNNNDLIIWIDQPIDPPLPFPILVVRTKPQKGNRKELQERLNVDFRVCNATRHASIETRCPLKVPPGAVQEAEYQRNQDQELILYENRTRNTEKTEQVVKVPFALNRVVAVSYWSPPLEAHVPVDYANRIHVKECKKETCPNKCPRNPPPPSNEEEQEHPYEYRDMWDSIDFLCKTSDPAATPQKRKYGGACWCESTCFTPQAAALNSTWPWKSQEQQEFFHPILNGANFTPQQHQKKCKEKRKTKTNSSTYEARFGCQPSHNATLPCPIYGDFSHHLFFIPDAKLIFCGIPKVGITEWIKFFRYTLGAKDYLSLPHFKPDRLGYLMSTLSRKKAQEVLQDPTWTKAVFLRNPAERLLSGYLDKIQGQGFTQTVFKIGSKDDPKPKRKVLTFEEFVDLVALDGDDNDEDNPKGCTGPRGLHACTDPHWKPQVMTCGLDHLLPQFDFIGNFDHISEHTKLLLERVGLWEEFGATFDDGKDLQYSERHSTCMIPPPIRQPNETVWGFNQRGPSGAGKNLHATGSQSKLDKYYTPELLGKVRKAYALDFAVWDELKDRPIDQVAAGRDLKTVQNYCKKSFLE